MTVVLEAQQTTPQVALAGPTEAMRPERKLSDSFWMHTYKVELCPKKEFHDWEKCAYAHPGERARRRHPSKYQAVQCPEARAKKVCPRGMECPCTHHLFEYWLHPDRYLTCLCELGEACNRPICFFAHTEGELRPLPPGLSVAAQPPAPASHKAQQNRTGSAVSSNSTPTHSLVPDLVASFNQALAMQELQSSGARLPAAVSIVSGTGSDSGHSNFPPTAPGSGVQQLIEQMASIDTSTSSTAFSALDDLAGDRSSKHPLAFGSQSPTPLAIVVATPSPSDLQRRSSSLASGSPPIMVNGSPPGRVAGRAAARHMHPLQQLAQQQQPGRSATWHGSFPATAASSPGGSGPLLVMPATVQTSQANLNAQLCQLQNVQQYSNGASSSCNSPLALANSCAMGFTHSPTVGAICPGAISPGAISPVVGLSPGVSPRSVTSDIQDMYLQQQQQARSPMGVMNAAAVSQGCLSPNFLGQQQQQRYVQVDQGGAGYAVISMPAVVQPQMLPQQVYDDPAEHLSFSLWGGDGVAACHPGAQHQLLHQSQNLGTQQQQLQMLQRQQLLQLLQQQNLERQYQQQQMQQVTTAVSAPALCGGSMGSMQPGLGVGVAIQASPGSPGGHLANPSVQPGSFMNGFAPVNTSLMIGQGVSNVAGSGFEGFQALNLPTQQPQQQMLLVPQLHQAFGVNHNQH